MNKIATNTPRTRSKSAANQAKKRDVSPKNKRIRDESAADPQRIRYAFVPLLQRFRSEHTSKNKESSARTWIPVECSLLIRYEFASLSPQTRYAFVAILLYCGMRGIEEIPLDSKFMASALIIDERTLKKSLIELENANLLLERKKEGFEKEIEKNTQTDRNIAVCVDDLNLFSEQAEEKTKTEDDLLKIVPPVNSNGNGKHSIYSIEECLKYVEVCQSKGEAIQSPKALASHLHKTGEADAFIMATLYPAQAEEIESAQFGEPVKFSDQPCVVCFGAKMADVAGRGFDKCAHCRDERGKSTGLEPGEQLTES